MAALADMLSYAHENVLIPVLLANSSLSISLTPSTDILSPRRNPNVNKSWLCDEGRLTYQALAATPRLLRPLLRREGTQDEVSWEEALAAADQGLRAAPRPASHRPGGDAGPALRLQDVEVAQPGQRLVQVRLAARDRRAPVDRAVAVGHDQEGLPGREARVDTAVAVSQDGSAQPGRGAELLRLVA
jgi:hypothetical protein